MMSKKERDTLFERKNNIGPFSNCADIKPQKEGYNDAICEVCEKVFKTNKKVYICPDCIKKEKNKDQIDLKR